MKTKSCWGEPNGRIYNFIRKYGKEFEEVCIIGCSDGKYVFPFLRKGYSVTAVDIDKVALYGGVKERPIDRESVIEQEYIYSDTKPNYAKLQTEKIEIWGLEQRAQIENLSKKLQIVENDAFHNPTKDTYDVVFTSCSIQYKGNRDLSVEQIMNILKGYVKPGGYLYMDYMMPLQNDHNWKSELFFRNGEIRKHFDDNWDVKYIYEMSKPVFESAHIDRAEDHFHRFGYILAKKKRGDV